jgi:hypothetical protein
MTSHCYICSTCISKYREVCKDCLFNNNLTISLTDVKKKYKLTNINLKKTKLINFTYRTEWTEATRYLIYDIHKLAKQIVQDLNDTDPQKRAYNKQDIIIKKRTDSNNKIKERIKYMTENVKFIIVKYDKNSIVDINNKKLQKIIIEQANNLNISSEDGIINITTKLPKIIKDEEYKNEKKMQIDTKINELIKNKEIQRGHIKLIRDHEKYKEYILQNNNNLISTCDIIKNYVNINHDKETRKKKLNKLLRKKLKETEFTLSMTSMIYKRYINENYITIGDAVKKIIKSTLNKIERLNKKTYQ